MGSVFDEDLSGATSMVLFRPAGFHQARRPVHHEGGSVNAQVDEHCGRVGIANNGTKMALYKSLGRSSGRWGN